MKRSESIDQLAAALAVAQGQMGGALKQSANPFYKSRYADLASVWTACREPLANNGLAVVQSPAIRQPGEVAQLAGTVAPEVVVTTLLMHVSGQWIENTLSMWPKDNSPQAIGSCTSYARRYALAAMVGVFQADDDAEAAQDHETESPGSQEVMSEYMDQLTDAIRVNDVDRARAVWNELNTLGTAQEMWRVLKTTQKKALRELLQVTAPSTPTKQMSTAQAPAAPPPGSPAPHVPTEENGNE